MDCGKIGDLIYKLRKEKGLTQKELGDKLGITDRAVSKWERGLGCPDVSLLDDLSRILDVSILEILKGRLLDKDELTKNEDLIESMNYSKENFKYRLKKRANKILISIVVIVCIFLILVNVKSLYYLNRTYTVMEGSYVEDYEEFNIKLNSNIELIKNNQGIFSDEDYKLILEYLDLEKSFQSINDYLGKKTYTYEEIIDAKGKLYNYYKVIISGGEIYKLLAKYDYSVLDNMIYYYDYSDIYTNDITDVEKLIASPYHIDNGAKLYYVSGIPSAIIWGNYRKSILISDILKAGEISE